MIPEHDISMLWMNLWIMVTVVYTHIEDYSWGIWGGIHAFCFHTKSYRWRAGELLARWVEDEVIDSGVS